MTEDRSQLVQSFSLIILCLLPQNNWKSKKYSCMLCETRQDAKYPGLQGLKEMANTLYRYGAAIPRLGLFCLEDLL